MYQVQNYKYTKIYLFFISITNIEYRSQEVATKSALWPSQFETAIAKQLFRKTILIFK
jgi:hypothetical protein